MKYNRIFAMLLALAMLLTMAVGCSKTPEQENTPNKPVADAPVQETDDPADDASAQDETAAPEEEPVVEYVGSVSTGTYYNPYFDLSFSPASDWNFYDSQTLLTMTAAATDLNGKTLAEVYDQQLEAGATPYVMMAMNAAGESANIVIQKTQPEVKGLNDEQLYAELMPMVEAQLQQAGLTDASVEIGKTTFLEEECAVLHTTISAAGVMQKQIHLLDEEYTCIITASAFDEASVDAIMALFHQ